MKGPAVPAGAFVATCATVVAAVLLMLAFANLAFLFVGDAYNAIIAAFVVFAAVVAVPGGLFIYRPDVIGANATVRDLLVFPANLIWHQNHAVTIALVTVPILLLERMDGIRGV